MSRLRKGRHCVFLMHVHLVFVTKYRKGGLCEESLVRLKEIFDSVCEDFESELVEFKQEGGRRFLPGLNAGVSTPKKR